MVTSRIHGIPRNLSPQPIFKGSYFFGRYNNIELGCRLALKAQLPVRIFFDLRNGMNVYNKLPVEPKEFAAIESSFESFQRFIREVSLIGECGQEYPFFECVEKCNFFHRDGFAFITKRDEQTLLVG